MTAYARNVSVPTRSEAASLSPVRRVSRSIGRLLAGPRPTVDLPELWQRQSTALVQARMLVRAFYGLIFFLVAGQWADWQHYLQLPTLRPLWPVVWVEWVGLRPGVMVLIVVPLVSVAGAMLWPEKRIWRIAAAISTLCFGAFFNSFGSTMHAWHVYIWVSALFCLLPRLGQQPRTIERQAYLRVVFAAIAGTLLFYSLSGSFKIAAGIVQTLQGDHGSFHYDALARHIAYRQLEGMDSPPPLGGWAVRHPLLIWPMFLSALYLESCSFIAAFRPKVHRLWGVMLIGMHMGIIVLMGIPFLWQILALGLLLVCSPFAPAEVRVGQTLRSLPIFGDLWALARCPR